MRRKFRMSSLSAQLSLFILILTTSLLVTIVILNYNSSRKLVHKESIEHAQAALDNTVLRVDNLLNSVETAVENVALALKENIDNPDYLYGITRYLVRSEEYVCGSALAFEPNYLPEKGHFFAPYSYRSGDTIISKQLGNEDYDYHYMDWYQIPKLLNQPYWSEPYFDQGGADAIMTTYSYPLYDDNGKLFAILTADISLELFAEEINSIKTHINAFNALIGRGGTVLVHRDKDFILNKTLFEIALYYNDSLTLQAAHNMVDGKRGMVEYNYGEERFLFYAPIKATGWSAIVSCMHSDIFANVYNMRTKVMMVAIPGLALLVLLCFLLIHYMMHPLHAFAEAATEIAKGNFSAKLPSRNTSYEMKTLHRSFSHLQNSLQNHIDQLQVATVNKERIESELRIARDIQMGMVPKIFPPFPEREDVDLYAKLIPAKEVGGDLYDFFIENNKLHFIIGDVSGKGVPASLVMSVTCRLFRTVASSVHVPSGIMKSLNDALSESNESNMFCTAFVGVMDFDTGILKYCNAGHNPPVIIDAEGNASMLPVIPNLALGIWKDFEFEDQEIKIEKGSNIFLYTDGVNEAESVSKEQYGEERMLKCLAKYHTKSPRIIVEEILKEIKDHAAGAEQNDDITILCCKLTLVEDTAPDCELVMRNDTADIMLMAEFVEGLSEKYQLPMDVGFSLNLALEEAVANVMKYAYPEGETHDIVLSVKLTDNRLMFKLIDTGKPFDPTIVPDADVNLSAEDRQIGGLGIFLVRQIMDSVEYRRIDGKNILTMIKLL